MLSEPEPGMIGKSARAQTALRSTPRRLIKRELFAVEVAHHKLVVGFDGALDKRLAGRGHGVGHIGGHIALGEPPCFRRPYTYRLFR